MIGIYKIINHKGKIYIGQSVNIKRRWYEYRLYLAKKQRLLHYSFKTYGYDNHKFKVLEECQKHELKSREYYYITTYKSYLDLNCVR